MFTLSINTLGQIAPQHGISANELSSQDAKLPLFIERIYARNVGFHECINDTDMVESIQLFQKDVKENFTDIVRGSCVSSGAKISASGQALIKD